MKDSLVYVADKGAGDVKVFNEQGSYKSTIGSHGLGDGKLLEPRYISVNAAGHVLVTDSASDDVEVFTVSGASNSGFGIEGTDVGEFDEPRGVASFEGSDYVLDQGNSRIQQLYLSSTTATLTDSGSDSEASSESESTEQPDTPEESESSSQSAETEESG